MNSRAIRFCGHLAKILRTNLFFIAGVLYLSIANPMGAQTAGQGAIPGTVTDSTGAVVTNATVIATNAATNVTSQRTSSSPACSLLRPCLRGPIPAPLQLRSPGNPELDAAMRKSFNMPKDFGTFVFEVDCINVWNKVVFSTPTATFGNSNFGQITSVAGSPRSRDFQFPGHLNF
jgi:hypothetical protein